MCSPNGYKIYFLLLVIPSIILLYHARISYLSWYQPSVNHSLEYKASPCNNGITRNGMHQLSDPPSVILSPAHNYCHSKPYLVVVFTRVSEPSVRESFRNTYGRLGEKYNFTVLFPVGLSEDKNITKAIEEEMRKFGDILQTDFVDSYHNLTLKSYSYTNYVRHNCLNVRAVIKMDDDLAWKVDRMFDYLSEIDTADNILYCLSIKHGLAIRNVQSLTYVSKEEYPYRFFPEYCRSPIYVATPSTIAQLADASSTIPLVWIDDVWSNGIVAAEIGAKFRLLPSNPDPGNFEPFLNGSAITQYFEAEDDGPMLFKHVNGRLLS